MSAFRTLLWWLLLAALGALAYELLARDLGEVVVRWHGLTATTTVAFALVAWGLLWFLGWLLWTVLRLPFTAWQRLAQAQARKRLINGLVATARRPAGARRRPARQGRRRRRDRGHGAAGRARSGAAAR